MRVSASRTIVNGVNVTNDLNPQLLVSQYTDKLHGEVDEIELELQDKFGLWRGPWCPEEGDIIRHWFGWSDGPLTYAGEFEVDDAEAHVSRDGDTVVVRGLAAPISAPLRTNKRKMFENKSLRQIMEEVAADNGLTLEGSVHDLQYEFKMQPMQRGLEFLKQLGEDTDHYVSVRGRTLQVYKVDDIDGAGPVEVVTPDHRDFVSVGLRLQTSGTVKDARVRHLHEDRKEVIRGDEEDSRVKTGDSLVITNKRIENEEQARLMARGNLHHRNRHRRNCGLLMVGRPDFVAGARIDLADFGKWTGSYVIEQSHHKDDRRSYTTRCDLKEARQ